MREEVTAATSPRKAGRRAALSPASRLSDPKTWVEEHGNYLFRDALIRVRNETVAEDLVQDTLPAAFQGKDRFSGQFTERRWLTGILKHKVLDHFRRQARERTVMADDSMPEELEGRIDDLSLWKHEPDHPRAEAYPSGPEAGKPLSALSTPQTVQSQNTNLRADPAGLIQPAHRNRPTRLRHANPMRFDWNCGTHPALPPARFGSGGCPTPRRKDAKIWLRQALDYPLDPILHQAGSKVETIAQR